MKTTSTMIILLLFFITAQAQQFTLNGTATQTGVSCYQLTDAATGGTGAAWYSEQIDLSVQSFDFSFKVYLGNNDGGADGMVFVLQKSPLGTAILGGGGGGMGFSGVFPSIGIEMDTYNNGGTSELPEDHVALDFNGNTNSGQPIVTADAFGANIEDGNEHWLRVVYSATNNLIKVYFDGVFRIGQKLNVNSLFHNNPVVYWGFTAGTGGATNTHYFCIKKIDTNPKLEAEEGYFEAPSLNVFPNPAKKQFTVDFRMPEFANIAAEQATLEVINLLGQVIHSSTEVIADGYLSREIETDAQAGMYLVKVKVNDQEFSSRINLQ